MITAEELREKSEEACREQVETALKWFRSAAFSEEAEKAAKRGVRQVAFPLKGSYPRAIVERIVSELQEDDNFRDFTVEGTLRVRVFW